MSQQTQTTAKRHVFPLSFLRWNTQEGLDLEPWVWLAVALIALLMFAAATVLWLWLRYEMSGAVLKTAKALHIVQGNSQYVTVFGQGRFPSLQVSGKTLEVDVTDPQQVKDILAALEIQRAEIGYWGYTTTPQQRIHVDFILPEGKRIETYFNNPTQLDRTEWGQIHITPRFHSKVESLLKQEKEKQLKKPETKQ